ncbi:MAG: hypothetical protein DWQ47_12810 [Acidobacteria bacterium]|nr:MAG: hypothetical protein DWQ32_00210 [Acidobacteriota bacterium]REK03038.1 MAG: hypothetical protein DWQ38_11925 [Acidobacteriota bacterium]REK13158.1 MAG: hypothetical protein DWQ43_05900 [Acidobacteriota bacterium]REK41152.1 MAG: hypothetical protein DWQ47_12810 [Acidobacteriota bacterium]
MWRKRDREGACQRRSRLVLERCAISDFKVQISKKKFHGAPRSQIPKFRYQGRIPNSIEGIARIEAETRPRFCSEFQGPGSKALGAFRFQALRDLRPLCDFRFKISDLRLELPYASSMPFAPLGTRNPELVTRNINP